MQKLIRGIHQFQRETFLPLQGLFEQLAKGQNPDALFITCSDSRIDPALLTQTQPGELFILRNAGNIIPPYGAGADGEAATIEFAVAALSVKDIIICGHSHCGAMHGVLHPDQIAQYPALTAWLTNAQATGRIIRENYQHLTGPPLLMAAIEENVLVQMEHLRTHPTVASRLERGELHLHGWVYKMETGQVFAYEFESGQFLPLAAYQFPEGEAELRSRTRPSI